MKTNQYSRIEFSLKNRCKHKKICDHWINNYFITILTCSFQINAFTECAFKCKLLLLP